MKFLFIALICALCINPVMAFSEDDCKIVLSENTLDKIVKESIKGEKLSAPGITLSDDTFNFKITYKHWLAGRQNLEFIGFIRVTEQSDLFIAITKHKRNGSTESDSTTRDRVEEIVTTINDNKEKTLTAEFVKNYTSAICGIKLKTGSLTIMPALGNLKLRDFVIRDGWLEVATTKNHAGLNSNADVQAFVGQNVLNALLEKFSKLETAKEKLNYIRINLDETASQMSFSVTAQNETSDCTFQSKAAVNDINIVELPVHNPSVNSKSLNADELINIAIRVINAKINGYKSPIRGKKMQFKYENSTIKFEANLDDIVPLKVKPGIFNIDSKNKYVNINAQVF